jgi:hypothetical protein
MRFNEGGSTIAQQEDVKNVLLLSAETVANGQAEKAAYAERSPASSISCGWR